MDNKMLTVRLPADQAEELEAVAQVNGVPVAEEVRAAIAGAIERSGAYAEAPKPTRPTR